jgi:hypothetical protein
MCQKYRLQDSEETTAAFVMEMRINTVCTPAGLCGNTVCTPARSRGIGNTVCTAGGYVKITLCGL